ncbi:YjgB family protein [Paenibacillus dokdonensis]|uniref:YjgB family protein n=1 Tax=Paenibacillus dokdonensis TaxID=2567944 RepID=A0ABU6GUF3_9BACL|nr:YjgB family protein [Paenibacillus dokdonensis]MEC0242858.1 YjgB family protein [Paenibacillus dokdonensis]
MIKQPAKKAVITLTMAGVVGLSALGVNNIVFPIHQADAAATTSTSSYASQQAIQTLNSFYKPALKGQFPGAVSGLTIGQSTKQNVIKKIGEPTAPGKNFDAFDLYSANMGNPGYAFSYKLNKVHEIRYFGTNVERQTNIGGITMKMVKQNWFAPSSTTTFKNGKTTQTKLTYIRGDYKLEFIFNSSTNLDHINLLAK